MRIGYTLLTAFAITFLFTIGLTLLPEAMSVSDTKRESAAVFQGLPIQRLTNANIVDALLGVGLRERLGRVEWRSSVLSLELLVPRYSGRPETWFGDVEKLISFAFVQLNNANRLLVRIVETDGNIKRLLAAVDVRAEDQWLKTEMSKMHMSDPVHDETWRQRLRLSFTKEWIERFGTPSGYSTRATQTR